MLQFNYQYVSGFPVLAWYLRTGGGSVDVLHGKRVERQTNFFTDGVWAGEFSAGRLDQEFCCGTGAILDERGLTIVGASTLLDTVFTTSIDGEFVASNSLPLLLAALDDALNKEYIFYNSIFTSTSISSRAPSRFRTKKRRIVRMLRRETALIAPNGLATVKPRPLDQTFGDFTSYRCFLEQIAEAIIRNANSTGRIAHYEPLATLSSGYDSPAVAVLMKEAGGHRAVTMRRYGENGELVDYPGQLAKDLGLDLIEVERDLWRSSTDFPDAEIACAGTGLLDIPLLALEPELPGKLVFTGFVGTNIWNKQNFKCYRDIVRMGETCGQGLAEYRLRHDFVVCPLPVAGATAHPDLYRIANSVEMRPWSVGGTYDSPIARRIIEEGGGKRGTFATRKYAGGGALFSNAFKHKLGTASEMEASMRRYMTNRGAASFAAFCVDAGVHRQRRRLQAIDLAYRAYQKFAALDYRVGKRLHKLGIKGLVPLSLMTWMSSRLMLRGDYKYLLPHWGTEVVGARYKRALENLTHNPGSN